VTKFFLSAVLLLATPAFATITKIQSNATWATTNTTSCTVTLSNTSLNNLLVVWATWSPSSVSVSNVQDSNNPQFPSAVGPTVQSASNTAAQILYQNNIRPTSGTDTVKVTFSGGTASTASCVAVEYSGADLNYPLDSVSAGYSTSGNPTSLLDSGTVAPANSNLLVFAGGVSDSGTANAGTGFTGIQSHNFSSGMAITEQNTSTITGNNVLQRATACLSDVSCLAPVGDWVMQMAVFRDASWTVTGAWSPVRIKSIRYADQFPGVDIGDQINHAPADCPPAGCVIHVAAGSYPFSIRDAPRARV
jgi:hypothetical protein